MRAEDYFRRAKDLRKQKKGLSGASQASIDRAADRIETQGIRMVNRLGKRRRGTNRSSAGQFQG